MRDVRFRYLIGSRPDPELRCFLAELSSETSQWMPPGLFHLTFCVIAELEERDPFLLSRVRAALADHALNAFRIGLGRVEGGARGAVIRTLGRQDDIQDVYASLVRLLRRRGIAPMHRKAGLNPHVTLGHTPCELERFTVPVEWFIDELLLIESEVGRTTHNVLGSWRLHPPPQGSFPFAPPTLPLPARRLAS